MRVRLPNNWLPRDYQRPLWSALEGGATLAYAVWHRRAGKDDVALHWAAVAAHERVGNYWHMLPEGEQARKAIWEAVNPHSGKRRIAEAFPAAIRETTRENEMLIRLKCGSTWQVIGSDNYDRLVGAPPIGVVFSEWALAKPQAWAYLRPILAENGGWALFITTPRGNNHAARMYNALQGEPGVFTQRLPATETTVFSPEKLEHERRAYIAEYGEAAGLALFEQEYLCSFDAAVVGSIFGRELQTARDQGRIQLAPYDPARLVYCAWDIGIGDSTAIWFAQTAGGEVRLIDYYESSGEPITHYLSVLRARAYQYATQFMPHDAGSKQLATGKSIADHVRENGFGVHVLERTSVETRINAARVLFRRCVFDKTRCESGLDALSAYRWRMNKRLDEVGNEPEHDWASHGADAFTYLAMAMDHMTEARSLPPIKYRDRPIA